MLRLFCLFVIVGSCWVMYGCATSAQELPECYAKKNCDVHMLEYRCDEYGRVDAVKIESDGPSRGVIILNVDKICHTTPV